MRFGTKEVLGLATAIGLGLSACMPLIGEQDQVRITPIARPPAAATLSTLFAAPLETPPLLDTAIALTDETRRRNPPLELYELGAGGALAKIDIGGETKDISTPTIIYDLTGTELPLSPDETSQNAEINKAVAFQLKAQIVQTFAEKYDQQNLYRHAGTNKYVMAGAIHPDSKINMFGSNNVWSGVIFYPQEARGKVPSAFYLSLEKGGLMQMEQVPLAASPLVLLQENGKTYSLRLQNAWSDDFHTFVKTIVDPQNVLKNTNKYRFITVNFKDGNRNGKVDAGEFSMQAEYRAIAQDETNQIFYNPKTGGWTDKWNSKWK